MGQVSYYWQYWLYLVMSATCVLVPKDIPVYTCIRLGLHEVSLEFRLVADVRVICCFAGLQGKIQANC